MKIIITAGGTAEKIDPVRKIANTGTGRLGSLTAEEFCRQGGSQMEKIYYLCERGSIVPESPRVEIVQTQGVDEVKTALEHLLISEPIDAVVHSMAVSDYAVESMTTAENLAQFLAEKLDSSRKREFPDQDALANFLFTCIKSNDRLLDRSKKVGSNLENMMLTMRQTPKLIGLIKTWRPSVILVGFKLLNGVSREELLNTAYGVMTRNSCDLMLANDQTEISGDRHVGYLLSADRSYERFEKKAEIAGGIAAKVLRLIKEKT